MSEWHKTFEEKKASGFFDKYMSGHGLDIGYKGYVDSKPILPNALGIDLDYPGYDGSNLPFPNESQDFVYSSHALEHISNWLLAIKEWYRVVKKRGYIITVVPHQWLYEKQKDLPSRFNPDHKRFYTPGSLLAQFEIALEPNSFRVRHLQDNDQGHDYTAPATAHANWCYELELVIQKL